MNRSGDSKPWGRGQSHMQRPRSHVDPILPQLIISDALQPHPTAVHNEYIIQSSVWTAIWHYMRYQGLCVHLICLVHSGQNSKSIQSVHRKFNFISHKPRCVCSVTILISLTLNWISTLNPQFQLIADNLIEPLQVNAIKLVITVISDFNSVNLEWDTQVFSSLRSPNLSRVSRFGEGGDLGLFSNSSKHLNHLGSLWIIHHWQQPHSFRFSMSGMGGPKICIPNKFVGEADAVGVKDHTLRASGRRLELF